MRILYIHQYFNTPEEGGGTRSYEFARSLVKRGHKVTILTGSKLNDSLANGKKKTDEYIEGVHVIYLKTPYSTYMPFKKRLYSFMDFSIRAILAGIRIKRYDLIFATSTPLTVAIPGIILSFLRRVPMVFEVRDLWPEVPIQIGVIKNSLLIKFLRWFEAFTYRHSNHIIALSPGMAKGILATGVAIDKVTMIPNFCNLDFFKPEKSNINNLGKLEYNNNPIIAYCGAISYANNLELIIHAAEKLQKMNNPAIFVIAGEGSLKPKLEKLTKVKKLKNVVFLGKINKYEVVELYRKAIACLILFKNLPILSTNSPNKFFDALAAGRPIITNMGGWIGNLVENYKIGFSLENDNPQAIIEAVEKLTSMNKNQLEEMGQNARELAAEKFNREDMVEKLEMVFKKAIKFS
jgi:glycosyltransferase involved in cell wall biosynthesis